MKRIIAWLLTASLAIGSIGTLPASAAGAFNTNLKNLHGLQGQWSETADGLHGAGNGDCFAMSETVLGDFTYETKVTFNQNGTYKNGAASLVFRSNDTGSQAYVANVDLQRGDARMFKFPAQGAFEFGSYPLPNRSKTEYTLRIEAIGSSIRFYVDGQLAVSANDTSYQSGKLGLLIWTNDATFQDVLAYSMDEADIPHLTDLAVDGHPDAVAFDPAVSDFHSQLPYSAETVKITASADEGTEMKISARSGDSTLLAEEELVSGENSSDIMLPIGVSEITLKLSKPNAATLNKTLQIRRKAPVYGDINSDGRFTDEDMTILTEIIDGVKTPDRFEAVLADVNHDGKTDAEDKAMLTGKITEDNKITERLSYADVVGKMTDLRALAEPVKAGERSGEQTSYDRRSRYDEATGHYIDWAANDDWGTQFETTPDGGKILADMTGAGAVVRIWSAQPQNGHVKVFIDGEETPAVDMPFSNYFSGAFPFNLTSMAYEAGRGMNCYIPITYNKSCKVVAYGDWGRYFHIGYVSFPETTSVEPFSLPLSADGQRALIQADRTLSGGHTIDAEEKTVTVPAHGSVDLYAAAGAGAVTGITARVNGLDNVGDDWKALAELAISANWDNEAKPSVWTTLGGFFASICGVNEYESLPLGVKEDGTMYADWYMPYSDGAKITLQNDGDSDYSVSYAVASEALDKGEADEMYRFHAKWNRLADPAQGERWPDTPFLEAEGSGRFVGTSLHIYKAIGTGDPAYNPDWWWGEGDEKFFVDGEKFPSWFGTGSEDYFGYAWGTWKTFAKPYHSQPFTNGGMFGIGNRLNNRFHIIDSVPFTESFSANLEKYHRDEYANMTVTNYWYQPKGVQDKYEAVSLETRTEYYENPYPAPATFYEGEEMKIIESTGMEKAETQDMSPFTGEWSNGSQLIFKAQQGNYVKLYINAPETADYRVSANFTKAGDFGIATHYIDGVQAGAPVDLYNNGVIRTDEVNLDTVRLTEGLHVLEVRMDGKNGRSSGYFYGLDSLKLTNVGKQTRISCVGDSITYGEFCTYGNRDTQSYPAQLQALLGDGYKVSNFGVNGATMMDETRNQGTPYILKNEYRASLESQPDIVIIKLGTNDASDDDTNRGNPAIIDTYYKQDALELINTYKNLPTKPKVCIATSATCYFNTDQPSVINNKIVPLQKEVAAETGCEIIDINTATANAGYLFPDQLHPNARGYGMIASVVCAAIMSEKQTTPEQIALAHAYAAGCEAGRHGQGIYTDESYAALVNALGEAKNALLNIKALTADEITAKATALNAAVEGLAEAEVAEGPVLHYDFNTIENGKVKDTVNGLDAVVHGSVEKADGFSDGAADFKGNGDYLELPADTIARTRDITITAWVKLRRNNTWSVFLVAGDGQADCMSFATKGSGLGLSCGFNVGGSEERVRTSTSNAVPTNKWAHIVYTQKGKSAKIYLNGKQIGSQTLSLRPADLLGSTTIQLGASHLFPSDPSLSGLMEDFAVYNQSMTADEIKDLYNEGVEQLNAITEFTAPDAVSCNYGAAFESLGLPEAVAVALKNGTASECAVEWDKTTFDSLKSGEQTVKGALKPISPMTNPGGFEVAVKVTVGAKPLPPVVKVDKVAVSGKTTVTAGQKIALTAAVTPANATNKTVVWSSSNNSIAMVANGVVTAKRAGKVVITASADGKSASVTITVKPKKITKIKVSVKKKKATVKFKAVKGVKKYTVTVYKGKKKIKTATAKKGKITVNKKLKRAKYTVKIRYKQSGVYSDWATKAFKVKK